MGPPEDGSLSGSGRKPQGLHWETTMPHGAKQSASGATCSFCSSVWCASHSDEVLFRGQVSGGLAISGAQFPGARTATPSWEWRSPGVITVLGDRLHSLPWAQQASPCFRATQEGGNHAASSQAGQRCSRKAGQGAAQLLRVGVPSLANLRHTQPQPGFTGHLLPVP